MKLIGLVACLGRTINKSIKKFDLFSHKIMLTYKGESSFSTLLGGIASLMIMAVVCVYAVFLFQIMINRENSNNSKSTEVVDLAIHNEDYYLADYGFAFGIAITDGLGRPVQLDPTMFSLDIYDVTPISFGNYINYQYTSLGYKLCDSNDLPGLSAEFIKRGLNSSLYCPINKRYKVAGHYLSNNYHFITISFKKCVGAGCKPNSIIDAAISGLMANVVYINSYMDFNDFNNPIKTSLDDRISYYTVPNFTKIVKMYAKLNKATLDDDYFKINSSAEKQFFSIDRVVNDFSSAPTSTIFSLSIFMDPNRDLYQRTVFSILDLFGTIGGIFGLLTSACGFVIGFVSTQIMLSSIFRRLYYTNKFDPKSTEMIRFGERDNKLDSKLEEKKEENNKVSDSRIEDLRPNTELNLQFDDNQRTKEDDSTNAMQMNKMKNILLNRRKYQANCTHKILTFIPSCLCKYKCILKNKEMYYEGEERYLKDLDCVSIVKSIRELKALTRILLNQQQRQILEFERESVLPCNKLLELEEIDFIQNKVPFEYSGSLKQDCYRDSVNKFVEEFSNRELTSIDMKIIDEVANEVDTSNLNSNIQTSLVVIDTQHDTRIRPKLHSK